MDRRINIRILCLLFGLLWMVGCFSMGFSYECYEVNEDRLCFSSSSTKEYDWNAANAICQRDNSTLPVIRNIGEQRALADYFRLMNLNNRRTIPTVWTAGKRRTLPEWTWIDGQPMKTQIISNQRYDRTQVQLLPDVAFVAENPGSTAWYICQYRDKLCRGPDSVRLTNSCVVLSDNFKSWFDARHDCSLKGGDLAVLNDHDLQMLKWHSEKFTGLPYWIGLGKASWLWMLNKESTESMNYTTKLSGDYKPTQHNVDACIHNIWDRFDNQWHWELSECREKKTVVCQTRANKMAPTIIRPTTTESTYEETCDCVSYATFSSLAVLAVFLGIASNFALFIIFKRRRERREALVVRAYEELSTGFR